MTSNLMDYHDLAIKPVVSWPSQVPRFRFFKTVLRSTTSSLWLPKYLQVLLPFTTTPSAHVALQVAPKVVCCSAKKSQDSPASPFPAETFTISKTIRHPPIHSVAAHPHLCKSTSQLFASTLVYDEPTTTTDVDESRTWFTFDNLAASARASYSAMSETIHTWWNDSIATTTSEFDYGRSVSRLSKPTSTPTNTTTPTYDELSTTNDVHENCEWFSYDVLAASAQASCAAFADSIHAWLNVSIATATSEFDRGLLVFWSSVFPSPPQRL
jgi:hypothetical protein